MEIIFSLKNFPRTQPCNPVFEELFLSQRIFWVLGLGFRFRRIFRKQISQNLEGISEIFMEIEIFGRVYGVVLGLFSENLW